MEGVVGMLVHPGLNPESVAVVGHGAGAVVLAVGGHCSWVATPDQADGLCQALGEQAAGARRLAGVPDPDPGSAAGPVEVIDGGAAAGFDDPYVRWSVLVTYPPDRGGKYAGRTVRIRPGSVQACASWHLANGGNVGTGAAAAVAADPLGDC